MGTIWTKQQICGDGPKYKRVIRLIRDTIEAGGLAIGDRLPPVRELAWQLDITPGTVARAYSMLTDEGLLLAEVGRGTFVAPSRTEVLEDVWSQPPEPAESQVISLFSPKLPDAGQGNAIRTALAQIAKGPVEGLLNYPTRDAYLPIRQAVVDWVADLPLGALGEEDVVLAHGGQSAITLVLQTALRGPKPVLLVEELSYAGFRRAAEIMRAEVIGVAMDEQGVLPEALEQAAKSSGAQLFCTTPEVQNPTGGHTSLERRKAVVAVARRLGMGILEDDCYGIARPRAPSYRALMPENTWHVSSISKSLTPALRFGYALAPTGRAADLRRVAEYGFFGLAYPVAELARILLTDPATRRIAERSRARVGDYVEVAVNALGGFELQWDREVPFVWLHLPPGWRAAGFCRAAENQGVLIRSADEFALRDGRAPHAVRIAVNGQVALKSFESAMLRLRMLLDNPPEQISV